MILYKNVDICDLESIVQNGILSMDECGNNNWDDYKEYIIKKVLPTEITKIIIPKIFKEYIDIPQDMEITWCDFRACEYGDHGLEECDQESIKQFAKTAPLMDSTWFNFFRGVSKKNTVIDLYNVEYIF